MRKLLMLLVVVGAAGWWVYQNYEIDVSLRPRGKPAAPQAQSSVPPVRPGDSIRIASFNIQVFGEAKLSDARSTEILARIVRMFDVVAVQEIRTKNQDFLDRFLRVVNSTGMHYDYVIGPRLGRTTSTEQYAYIFDLERVEVDSTACYTVQDPLDQLHREPFTASFRCRAAPVEQAFTFTLVNIHTDPDETKRELDALDDVYRAVRNDGREEDDVILLGDLNVDEDHLGQLGAIPYIQYVIGGVPTNVRRTATYDNILFDSRATTEFRPGQFGIINVMQEFNITLEEAERVSDHVPIWAEFSVYEGGRPGNVAAAPGAERR